MLSNAFFALWVGDTLSPYEQLSLKSFLDFGHDVALNSYSPDAIDGVPQGISIRDAYQVLPEANLERFRDGSGHINAAPYSDLFRYAKLSGDLDEIWIDTDLICLKPDWLDWPAYFGYESENVIAIGVFSCKFKSSG